MRNPFKKKELPKPPDLTNFINFMSVNDSDFPLMSCDCCGETDLDFCDKDKQGKCWFVRENKKR